jgi:hypothetical protein
LCDRRTEQTGENAAVLEGRAVGSLHHFATLGSAKYNIQTKAAMA